MQKTYKALVSSDWSECLSPCGPFDVITHYHPGLQGEIESIFRRYTANAITLSSAITQVGALLPAPINREQMDAYLDEAFRTYPGVCDLIENCLDRGILFMINTTGMLGFFQRALAKHLLPPLPLLSAHAMIAFGPAASPLQHYYPLREIEDKPKNTAAAAAQYQIAPAKIVIIGDSGGDGPHFKWGAQSGARLIGSMTKPSLADYCRQHGIRIDHHFGCIYKEGESRRPEKEFSFDFRLLAEKIEELPAR